MSDLLKNCVEVNGKLYCVDCTTQKFYQFDKKEFDPTKMSSDIITALLRKVIDNRVNEE